MPADGSRSDRVGSELDSVASATTAPIADTTTAYASTWLADESLESLNRRIHDGVAEDRLMDRARRYRDWLFDTYPDARPGRDARVVELGSGVGWIMEAMLERFPVEEIIGLDISANMIRRAQERFTNPAARFAFYDGLHIPFADGEIDVLYSVAAMQHIEKHVAFLLFEELYRILKAGGHGIIHLLAVDHIPKAELTYHDECWNHVNGTPTHWHHYYSFDELFVLFSDVIGVDDLDIRYEDDSFLVHFSKGSDRKYHNPDLPAWRYAAPAGLARAGAFPASTPAASTKQLLQGLAVHLYADARRVAGNLRSRGHAGP
jgi:ubiquinone/menaquinone biosynthesis C-methylase UbiE